MNGFEIIALVFAIIILVKTILIFTCKSRMEKLANKMMSSKSFLIIWQGVMVLVMGGLFYYLFTRLKLVEVASVIVVTWGLFALMLMAYPKSIKSWMKEIFKNPLRMWIVWLFLIVLSIAVLVKVL